MEHEILVYGFMDNDMALDFVRELKACSAPGNVVNCRVNSEGGSVFSGIAMYNAVRKAQNEGCEVNMFIEGLCASMASCFVMAGDRVYISKYATVMTHKPSSYGGGSADDLHDLADQVKALEPVMEDMYCAKTGMSRDEVVSTFLQDKDTWFNAKQAIAAKLADEVYDGPMVSVPKSTNKKAIFAAYAALTNKNQNTNMRQIPAALWASICATMGITDSVEDNAFLAALKKVQEKANKVDAIQVKLDKATQDLADEKKATTTKEITGMLQAALDAKKISAKQKELFAKQYEDDADGLKEVLESMDAYVSITSVLKQENKTGGDELNMTPDVKALFDKGWDKLHKEGGLAELKAKNEGAFLALYETKFKCKPNEKPFQEAKKK